jgi:lipopolysaccharide export system permease protein
VLAAPSPTLARYVARLFAARVAAVLAMLVAILLVLDLLGESGRILAVPGNGGDDVWTYVRLRLPQLVAQFLPFSVLLAALITFATLSAQGEVVIFKAGGLSAHQILGPMFLVGAAVALIAFVFNETVLTRSTAVLSAWKAADYAPLATLDRQGPRDLWASDGMTLVRARRPATGSDAPERVTDLLAYERDSNGRLVAVLTAPRAEALPGGGWRLSQARRFDVATGRITVAPSLDWPARIPPERFRARSVSADETPWWKLGPLIAQMRAEGRSTAALETAWHHKLAGPLSAMLMPLLGAVAAFGLARSGRLLVRAGIGMALGFLFFVADNFMIAMGGFNAVPPWVAGWAPLLLFVLIGESVLLWTEE